MGIKNVSRFRNLRGKVTLKWAVFTKILTLRAFRQTCGESPQNVLKQH